METSLGDLEIDLYVDECPAGGSCDERKRQKRREEKKRWAAGQ